MSKRFRTRAKPFHPMKPQDGIGTGLALALVAMIESSKLAEVPDREFILFLVGLWFDADAEDLLRRRIARVGYGKRPPQRVLRVLQGAGMPYVWNEATGQIERWQAVMPSPEGEVEDADADEG